MKQLQKGLQQLGEEGAVQVFKPHSGADLILGAVGVLQFEVVTARLAAEEGLHAGTSTGANVVAALRVAADLRAGATVVTVMCDSGLKYLHG